MSTWLGRGDGTFDAGQVLTAGKGVFEVLAADFNGDDRIDLVANNRGVIQSEFVLGDLSLFLGAGAGSFEAGLRIETGGSPIYLADADFDLDGRIDLVTANSSADASVLFGHGDGSFEPPERFGIMDYPAGIVARDLNGDGRADLVAVGQEDFVVLPNQISPPNAPPEASIAAPTSVECSGPDGAAVVLDGSGSLDPDSVSEDSSGIVQYEWFLAPGAPGQAPLGTGPILAVTLPLGSHVIGLRVTDAQGATGETQVVVTVRDTVQPLLLVSAEPSVLWPPNHRLVPVRLALQVSDRCDPAPRLQLVALTSSEPDDAPGDADGRTQGDLASADPGTSEMEILLRAERAGDGPGRIYEVTCAATDASGNTFFSLALISVPHDLGEGPEPLSIRAEPAGTAGSARLWWNVVTGAQGYDLVSGDLSSLRMEAGRISLGAVRVLARLTQGTSWSEADVAPDGGFNRIIPPRGRGFFYLVQYRDPRGPTGFGTESVPLPRELSACDAACPGRESELLVSTKAEPRRR